MNDDNIHTGICIVLPASHYAGYNLSHCTVAFLGNIGEVDFPRTRAQRIVDRLGNLDCWRRGGKIQAFTERFDRFGVEYDTHVAVLGQNEALIETRALAEDLLVSYGIPYSQMFEYTPHVSLKWNEKLHKPGQMHFPLGMKVMLSKPVLWWGDDRPKYPSNDGRELFV